MSRTRIRPGRKYGKKPPPYTRCPACGKHTFTNRKQARKAIRWGHPGDPKLAAYECPRNPGGWHYCHSSRAA